MQQYASKVSEGMALQLGCLEIRYAGRGALCSYVGRTDSFPPVFLDSAPRRFFKDMNPNGLEKKSNFELLE